MEGHHWGTCLCNPHHHHTRGRFSWNVHDSQYLLLHLYSLSQLFTSKTFFKLFFFRQINYIVKDTLAWFFCCGKKNIHVMELNYHDMVVWQNNMNIWMMILLKMLLCKRLEKAWRVYFLKSLIWSKMTSFSCSLDKAKWGNDVENLHECYQWLRNLITWCIRPFNRMRYAVKELATYNV